MNAVTEEFVKITRLLKRYCRLEIEYVKLTAVEKTTLLVSALAVGVIFLTLMSFMLLMLAFACVELFKIFMCPALAFLSTAGVFLILMSIMLAFREKWIVNPISRYLTKILFDKEEDN